MSRLSNRLSEIGRMKQGWIDGTYGDPIPPKAISQAQRVVSGLLPPLLAQGTAFPSSDEEFIEVYWYFRKEPKDTHRYKIGFDVNLDYTYDVYLFELGDYRSDAMTEYKCNLTNPNEVSALLNKYYKELKC